MRESHFFDLFVPFSKRYSSPLFSPTLLGQPIIMALFAMPILGKIFRVWHVSGGTLVILGVYLVHRSRTTEQLQVSFGEGL